MASITQRFLVPVSTVSARNAWHNDPPFVYKIRRKTSVGGGYFQKNWVGCAACLLKPSPYFTPKSVIFPTLFQTWSPRARLVTGARNKLLRHVHGWLQPREMALSPNDEEVAFLKNIPNSILECTNHTLFQTKIVTIDTLFQTKTAKKPYPLALHIPIYLSYWR